jgi:hypothetical protein
MHNVLRVTVVLGHGVYDSALTNPCVIVMGSCPVKDYAEVLQ